MRARRLLIIVTGLLIGCLAAGSAAANGFAQLQKDLERQKPPIDLDSIGVCAPPGAEKLACQLYKDASAALLVDMAGSGTLKKEADNIDVLRSGKYAGYALKTPEHGALFTLNVTKASNPKLKPRDYTVMLETWLLGSKIDNQFQDFASPPSGKDAFDGTQLGQAIIAQKLGTQALKTTSADIGNYKDLVSAGVYVVDVEFFVTAAGSVVLVDLAGGFGGSGSQVGKFKNRLTNALAAITKYAE